MPLQATSGAASYDAFGGGVPAVPQYIEDVFSTYLYTGTGADLTITNGVDLSTKGGLVWLKDRGANNWGHSLFDTARGAGNRLISSSTAAQGTGFGQTFTTSGFGLDGNANYNYSGDTFVGWTFRKQPKFFDVVTWTGDNSDTRYIFHSLTGTTGCVIAKRTDSSGNWVVGHRSITSGGEGLLLNSTSAKSGNFGTIHNLDAYSGTAFGVYNGFGSTDPANYLNVSGATYVAYVFAHNAGGFGLTGTDNVISCGSFTTDASSNATITLGWEPQWVLFKSSSSSAQGWKILDNMRGFPAAVSSGPNAVQLIPNSSAGETGFGQVGPNATGWGTTIGQFGLASETYIYIAIRRGPMAVPTSGTSVYNGIARTGNGTATTVSNSGFTPDMVMSAPRSAGPSYGLAFPFDRLRGALKLLETRSTNAEQTGTGTLTGFDTMNGYIVGVDASGYGAINANAVTYINWNFKRAPSFFDVVCYTGTSAVRTINHNLGVVPELMIVKCRSAVGFWVVYSQAIGNTDYLYLDGTGSTASFLGYWNNTTPTASVFTLGTGNGDDTNETAQRYVAYLFATCAGVSKVGSYTGTGTTKQIDCGFTGGARFVLIKRTDSTGDWYVWDSARGITAGNDPYLLLNSLAAEVSSTDYIDTYSAGFEISSTAPAAINANGGSFIFLAIA